MPHICTVTAERQVPYIAPAPCRQSLYSDVSRAKLMARYSIRAVAESLGIITQKQFECMDHLDIRCIHVVLNSENRSTMHTAFHFTVTIS